MTDRFEDALTKTDGEMRKVGRKVRRLHTSAVMEAERERQKMLETLADLRVGLRRRPCPFVIRHRGRTAC
jgi:hypothetical protein